MVFKTKISRPRSQDQATSTPEFKINEFLHQQKMSQMGWTPLTHGKTSPAASDVFRKAS